MSKEIKPEVYTSFFLGGKGQTSVAIKLSKPKYLTDINIDLLKQTIKRWKNRNTIIVNSEEDYLPSAPTIFFSVDVGRLYPKGEVVLCKVEDEKSPLTLLEKWAIKKAFKFSNHNDETPDFNTKKAINAISYNVVLAIRDGDLQAFEEHFEQLKDFHILLLQIGEKQDDNGVINYAVIETTWFENLHQSWNRVYADIYRECVNSLEDDVSFFKTASYTASHLSGEITNFSSMTSLDSVISFQGFLWFRLNDWWENQCKKKTSAPSNINPHILEDNIGHQHEEALIAYIEGWESLQGSLSYKSKDLEWDSYRKIFEGLKEHLISSILFTVKSVVTGNQEAAQQWIEHLIRWNENCERISSNNYHPYKCQEFINLTPTRDSKQQHYMYDINSAPLYNARALSGGTIVLPRELLDELSFKKMEYGLPVEVTFTEDEETAWEGSLIYHWEWTTKLKPYKVYKIIYPKIAKPEK